MAINAAAAAAASRAAESQLANGWGIGELSDEGIGVRLQDVTDL
jgi:hypothetical protein